MGRARAICAVHRCPRIATHGGKCAEHHTPRKRDPAQTRFYGSSHWKDLRARVRREEPTCALCGTAPSEVVDHVDADWRNNARTNLRALCKPCNASHTGRQHRRKQDDGGGGGDGGDDGGGPTYVFA